MEKIYHPVYGECTIFAELSHNIVIKDAYGNKYTCVRSELVEKKVTDSFVVISGETAESQQPQINVNSLALTAKAIVENVRGIPKTVATAIINNRPEGGYQNFDDLEARLSGKVQGLADIIAAIKADNFFVFGNQ
jgi:DNA uptake protein ComE-like DNA-binding protein